MNQPPASTTQRSAPGEPLEEPSLEEMLWSEPYRFEFFAALRVLARMGKSQPLADEEPDGLSARLRFRSLQSLSFPASEIWDIVKPAGDDRPVEMTVAFFGLTGPLGALPRPYSELVMQRVRRGDLVLRDFLDLFNHRLLKLFAKAGEKYRFYLTYEQAAARQKWRGAQGPQKLRGFLLDERPRIDLFSQMLLDLAGMGTPRLRYKESVRQMPAERIDVPDDGLRHFAGHLAQSHRSSAGLSRLVAGYFQVAVQIVPFVGQWVKLPVEYQTCLGSGNSAEPLGSKPKPGQAVSICEPRLGENTVAGSRTWEVQGRFRVRLGPLSFEQFQHYLPVGKSYRALAQLVRLYVGATFDFDIQPTLVGPEAPWCQLGAADARAPRLGWNTWLRNQPFAAPVDDAVFSVSDDVSMGA
ncbi:MAG: type VI secretion system baseplate subunit TssG [Pirellulaceae bacterium]